MDESEEATVVPVVENDYSITRLAAGVAKSTTSVGWTDVSSLVQEQAAQYSKNIIQSAVKQASESPGSSVNGREALGDDDLDLHDDEDEEGDDEKSGKIDRQYSQTGFVLDSTKSKARSSKVSVNESCQACLAQGVVCKHGKVKATKKQSAKKSRAESVVANAGSRANLHDFEDDDDNDEDDIDDVASTVSNRTDNNSTILASLTRQNIPNTSESMESGITRVAKANEWNTCDLPNSDGRSNCENEPKETMSSNQTDDNDDAAHLGAGVTKSNNNNQVVEESTNVTIDDVTGTAEDHDASGPAANTQTAHSHDNSASGPLDDDNQPRTKPSKITSEDLNSTDDNMDNSRTSSNDSQTTLVGDANRASRHRLLSDDSQDNFYSGMSLDAAKFDFGSVVPRCKATVISPNERTEQDAQELLKQIINGEVDPCLSPEQVMSNKKGTGLKITVMDDDDIFDCKVAGGVFQNKNVSNKRFDDGMQDEEGALVDITSTVEVLEDGADFGVYNHQPHMSLSSPPRHGHSSTSTSHQYSNNEDVDEMDSSKKERHKDDAEYNDNKGTCEDDDKDIGFNRDSYKGAENNDFGQASIVDSVRVEVSTTYSDMYTENTFENGPLSCSGNDDSGVNRKSERSYTQFDVEIPSGQQHTVSDWLMETDMNEATDNQLSQYEEINVIYQPIRTGSFVVSKSNESIQSKEMKNEDDDRKCRTADSKMHAEKCESPKHPEMESPIRQHLACNSDCLPRVSSINDMNQHWLDKSPPDVALTHKGGGSTQVSSPEDMNVSQPGSVCPCNSEIDSVHGRAAKGQLVSQHQSKINGIRSLFGPGGCLYQLQNQQLKSELPEKSHAVKRNGAMKHVQQDLKSPGCRVKPIAGHVKPLKSNNSLLAPDKRKRILPDIKKSFETDQHLQERSLGKPQAMNQQRVRKAGLTVTRSSDKIQNCMPTQNNGDYLPRKRMNSESRPSRKSSHFTDGSASTSNHPSDTFGRSRNPRKKIEPLPRKSSRGHTEGQESLKKNTLAAPRLSRAVLDPGHRDSSSFLSLTVDTCSSSSSINQDNKRSSVRSKKAHPINSEALFDDQGMTISDREKLAIAICDEVMDSFRQQSKPSCLLYTPKKHLNPKTTTAEEYHKYKMDLRLSQSLARIKRGPPTVDCYLDDKFKPRQERTRSRSQKRQPLALHRVENTDSGMLSRNKPPSKHVPATTCVK